MRRREFLKVSMSLMVCAPYSPCLFAGNNLKGAPEETIQRQIRLTLTLKNPKPYELADQVLWFYLPATETPTQKLESINVSIPHEQITDSLNHCIIKLSFPQVPPLSSKLVNLVINLSMKTAPVISSLENSTIWLKPERYIESDHAGIKSLAAKLKRPNARETALAIYEWAKVNLHYLGYLADDRGAAYAFNELKGDCTEYAYLAVALARANGMPARMVGGYTTEKNAILHAVDYHNWAEIYFDGAWRLLDAQKEHWLTPTEHYVTFRYYRDESINPIGLAHRHSQKGELEISF